ncbi:hypothetical protein DFS33DRAFT_1278228 [Desarmillaria ectypa]|nr:hypothetical protein DFS33DRAFT_1278228 [Desarmillaria ectypa]
MVVQTRAGATRMHTEVFKDRRRSNRLPPHVPFQFHETPLRKLKSRKGKGKKYVKSIKVTKNIEDDDNDSSDTPSSSVASAKRLFSAGVASATSLGPVPASKRATMAAGKVVPKNATIRQSIRSISSTHPNLARSLTQILKNNLAAAQSMDQEAEVFEEAFETLDVFNRRLSRNKMAQNTDKGKMKNLRLSMEAKVEKHPKRVRARSQSVIAMQLGMGLGLCLPHTPAGSRRSTPALPDLSAGPPTRENTPAPGLMAGPSMQPGALDWRELTSDVPTRQNTPQFNSGPMAGPSVHRGAVQDWKELTPVPTRQNTPQFEAGPSAPPISRDNPFILDLIEEEPMDMDIEFDPSN